MFSSFFKRMRGDYGNGKFNNFCKNIVCEIDYAVNNNESWASATGRIYNGTDLIRYQDELYELGGIVHLYFKVSSDGSGIQWSFSLLFQFPREAGNYILIPTGMRVKYGKILYLNFIPKSMR